MVPSHEASENKPIASNDSAGGDAQRQPQRVAIEIDESRAVALYANFCRVNGTHEELILDFGLNAQPIGIPSKPLVINQRIVLNYFTAKRLLQALHATIQHHETLFGVIETDVQRRIRPGSIPGGTT